MLFDFFTFNLSCNYSKVFPKLCNILQLNRLNAEADIGTQLSSIGPDSKEIAKPLKKCYFIIFLFSFGKHIFSLKCVTCYSIIGILLLY
jgi:hypothetical protein